MEMAATFSSDRDSSALYLDLFSQHKFAHRTDETSPWGNKVQEEYRRM